MLWRWNPNSCHYMLHKSKELLLYEELLLMHGLLLLLYGLLSPLKLILSSLELCKSSSCLLCLASLILPHPFKYGKKSGVYLRCMWS